MTTIKTRWAMATYDVWGNERDGYDVNDVYGNGEVELTLKVVKYNPGTVQEFLGAFPTDAQIKRVFGVRCHIETDGDDVMIEVNRARDGYPIGQLCLVSHKSLSPIRAS